MVYAATRSPTTICAWSPSAPATTAESCPAVPGRRSKRRVIWLSRTSPALGRCCDNLLVRAWTLSFKRPDGPVGDEGVTYHSSFLACCATGCDTQGSQTRRPSASSGSWPRKTANPERSAQQRYLRARLRRRPGSRARERRNHRHSGRFANSASPWRDVGRVLIVPPGFHGPCTCSSSLSSVKRRKRRFLAYSFPSRSPAAPFGSTDTFRLGRGRLPSSLPSPESGCQLHGPAATDRQRRFHTPARINSASRRSRRRLKLTPWRQVGSAPGSEFTCRRQQSFFGASDTGGARLSIARLRVMPTALTATAKDRTSQPACACGSGAPVEATPLAWSRCWCPLPESTAVGAMNPPRGRCRGARHRRR